MDCAATGDRPARVYQAIAAGKHIHIEKPTAPTVEEAMAMARAAHAAGVKHGVIQDKLFLPGFAKLLFVKNAGFFGRILSIHIDAGSWVFDGKTQECQRPSWNYKRAEGGGIALDIDGTLALHDRPAGRARDRCLRADGDGDTRARGRAGAHLHCGCRGHVARAVATRWRGGGCHYQ